MASRTVSRGRKKSEPPTIPSAKAEEAPVSSEIRRAAERIGCEPNVVRAHLADVRSRIEELRDATDEIINLAVSEDDMWRTDAMLEALRLVRSVRLGLEADISVSHSAEVSP
jgi:hypothetical protein